MEKTSLKMTPETSLKLTLNIFETTMIWRRRRKQCLRVVWRWRGRLFWRQCCRQCLCVVWKRYWRIYMRINAGLAWKRCPTLFRRQGWRAIRRLTWKPVILQNRLLPKIFWTRRLCRLWHRHLTQVQSVNFSATAFELIFPVCLRLISTCLPISILTYSSLSAPA